jgi:hypothetical protein
MGSTTLYLSTPPSMEAMMATKKDSDPRPSKADAPKDPRPQRADAPLDPRPTGKPVADGVDTTPDTEEEPAPRRAIADSLPPPDASGPGEQHHLDPSQRAESRMGGTNPGA